MFQSPPISPVGVASTHHVAGVKSPCCCHVSGLSTGALKFLVDFFQGTGEVLAFRDHAP